MMTTYDYERHDRISQGMCKATRSAHDANRCIEKYLATKDIIYLEKANEFFADTNKEYQAVLDVIEGRRSDFKGVAEQ